MFPRETRKQRAALLRLAQAREPSARVHTLDAVKHTYTTLARIPQHLRYIKPHHVARAREIMEELTRSAGLDVEIDLDISAGSN